ncbi:MAG: prepilin-type N-terminal cleavage/methylation domain-containing protein [Patescibacteria group bacterium]
MKLLTTNYLPVKIREAFLSGSLQTNKGFTLLELIVAIGVFSAVISASTGIFLSTLTAQRKAIALQNIQDNIRFAVESMAKEIRTGKTFSANPERTQLNFINAAGASVVYRLSGTAIERSQDNGTTFLPITADNIEVSGLKFYLSGEAESDGLQPKITITAKTRAKNVKIAEQSEMYLETTISAREIQS